MFEMLANFIDQPLKVVWNFIMFPVAGSTAVEAVAVTADGSSVYHQGFVSLCWRHILLDQPLCRTSCKFLEVNAWD
jgi:hypothetical protein